MIQQITVEKPYVVGDGVTLVPIRVVTEAFGAEVGWVSETKTVTLELRGERRGRDPLYVGCQDTQGTLEWVGQKVCLNFSIPSYRKT